MNVEQLAAEKAAARDKRRFVKLRLKGEKSSCIASPREAQGMLADDPDLTGEDVWMTIEEFEKLPEFAGW
jgi:catalase